MDRGIETAGTGSRERILAAAGMLLKRDGVEAFTIRAIATAAGFQAPAIYRLFGDKTGLLDALAEQSFDDYVRRTSARPPFDDPVDELKAAWNEHMAFGLSNPSLYRLMFNAGRHGSKPAEKKGLEMLRARVDAIARAGRLRMSQEQAVALIHAIGTGTVTVLLNTDDEATRAGLAERAWNALIATISGEATSEPQDGRRWAKVAATLRSGLAEMPVFSPGERALLDELLERASRAP